MTKKTANSYVFVWLVPIVWSVCSVVCYFYPGDEYMLYGVSSIAGSWTVMVFQFTNEVHNFIFPAVITLVGAGVMALAGFCMDKLSVNLKLWAVLWIILWIPAFALFFCRFDSYQEAINKHGSLTAYIFSSANIGLYLSVLFSSILRCLSLGGITKK